jgi:hypothetical protein
MNVKLNVTENSRVIKLVLSGTGVRGASGVGVPDGATDGQIAVYSDSQSGWVPTTVMSGLTRIAVVDALPDPQVTGTLYMVKS